jgi:ketosteroid isomerase-like protein
VFDVAGDESGAVLEWESAGSANGDEVSYRGATVLEYDGDTIVRSMAYFDPRAVGRQLVDSAGVRRPS